MESALRLPLTDYRSLCLPIFFPAYSHVFHSLRFYITCTLGEEEEEEEDQEGWKNHFNIKQQTWR